MSTQASSPKPQSTLQRQHPYPLVRSGGLFLLLIGAGIVAGALVGGREPVHRPIFFAATVVGFTALFAFAKRLSYGPPTRKQIVALVVAIALEVILLTTLSVFLPKTTARDYWLWTLLVVGIHFLPMGYAFGPTIAALGGACIINAIIGLASDIPFVVFGMMDGLLKMGFGFAMFRALPSERTNGQLTK
jgi:FtsH-binding integral membrane protein